MKDYVISFFSKYKGLELEKIIYFKEKKTLEIIMISQELISLREIKKAEKSILKKIDYIEDIHIKSRYSGEKGIEDFLEKYKDDIVFILQTLFPASGCLNDQLELKLDTAKLEIEIKEEVMYEYMKNKNAEYSIRNLILEELGLDIPVFLVQSEEQGEDYIKLEEEREERINKYLQNIVVTESSIGESGNRVKLDSPHVVFEKPSEDKILHGKAIAELPEDIRNFTPETGRTVLQGEVFDKEEREIKGGKIILTLSLTDYTSSINCKIFLKKDDELLSKINIGDVLRIRGEVLFDSFAREITMSIYDINRHEIIKRKDKEEVKRVELHAHTQMSAMDAICSAKDLIKRASELGHEAIAITDHGVVQAYPEAMEAGKKFGVKIIYGVEGYLIDDTNPLIRNVNDFDLNQEFIIFDIETTGLSPVNDKITEIGAVKIKNREVIELFSSLVDPERPIPPKIQELTGITNEMVKGKEKIEKVLFDFMDFVKDSVVVAHNADFDVSFIKANANRMGASFKNTSVDTLALGRALYPELKRHKLDVIAKHLGVSLENHHRAVDDATATASIFIKMIEKLETLGVSKLSDINDVFKNTDYKKIRSNHINILVKDYRGLKNLYKLISKAHIEYFYKNPRIPKSLLKEMREGLIIGTACEAGEFFQQLLKGANEEALIEVLEFYDFVEIMPVENNRFMIAKGIVNSLDDLRNLNKKIVEVAKKAGKLVVATGDVHFIEERDDVFRKILKSSQGFPDANEDSNLYLRTTDEMLKEFSYLGEELAREVVIENTRKIADMVESIIPVPEETYPPIIEGSEDELRDMCYKKATGIYGEPLPEVVQKRLDRELNSIIGNGYAVMYIIAQKLVTKSVKDGYLVGSRGSVGSSFAATMSDITEVNPLPPHYVCEKCKKSEFILDGSIGSGADLPDKNCPDCNIAYIKDGHDIPFEVFLGFEGDKEPDIDLNFAGEYQANAHKYTEVLFGTGYVFRAGTIGTVAEKTAYGFVKKYLEEQAIRATSAEVERLKRGCTGIKRTSGQHPGGVMVVPDYKEIYDFCPVQYPANDGSSGVITTHFDYHSISGRLLKLDILGHDVPTIIRMMEDLTGIDATKIPLGDKLTMSIFTSTEALGADLSAINCTIGSLGIPEFGTKFVRQMLIDTKPTTFAELVRISGLSHGTDVWLNNAQELVRNNIAELKDVISTRDDIMNYLIYQGLPPKMSFKIMENVRKGKGLTDEHVEEMKKQKVPQWYIDSCNKIKYMFPKAHAVAYVMMSFRIAYAKVHLKEAFYATYFTTKAEDFDADLGIKGKDAVLEKIRDIEKLGNEVTAKEKNMHTVLEVLYEMFQRNIELMRVDIYESDARKFKIVDGKLLPPLIALQGLGENAALKIMEEGKKSKFMSREDLRVRTKISKTVVETLANHGCLTGLPETNQLSLL